MIKPDYIQQKLNYLDVVYLKEVTSTNTYAKNREFNNDTLIVTTNQTAGRGRFSRSFYSHKDSGLYFTLALNDLKLDANINTLIMGLAVSDVLANSKIKWLNDILIDNKKIAGILAEGVISSQSQMKMVIGVGINLALETIPNELKSKIISYSEVETNFDINEILINIVNNYYYYQTLNRIDLINKYKAKCITLNQEVIYNEKICFAYDINLDGHLVVINSDGDISNLNAGEVSLHVQK